MPDTLTVPTDTAARLAALAARLAHLEDMITELADTEHLRMQALGRRLDDLEALLVTPVERRLMRGYVDLPFVGKCPIVLTGSDPTP